MSDLKYPMTSKRVVVLLAAIAAVCTIGRIQAGAGPRSMISIDDLNWKGMYSVPAIGQADAGAGTTQYSSGTLAVRYVGSERRLLVPNFAIVPATGQNFGDLVEWRVPAQPRYVGSDPAAAPPMVEVRRWKNWTSYGSTPSWQDRATGGRIGGIYFDQATNVIWYQIYNYYNSTNHPFLGATQLLDSADVSSGGNYAQVGVKYGPWWYGNTTTPSTEWKKATYWLAATPADAKADLGGHSALVGASVGSVGGSGYLGPGFAAIDFPSLNSAPNSVVPLGLPLADYSSSSTQTPSAARRSPTYSIIEWPGHETINVGGLYLPTAGRGYWNMSLDQVNSFVWVQTPTLEGILLFGREVSGKIAYGTNPLSLSAGWAGSGAADLNDLSRQAPDLAFGYSGENFTPMLFGYDASQVRQIGRGARSPFSDGINPIEMGNWKTKFPNVPLGKDGTGPRPRPTFDYLGNTGFWDNVAQELIWVPPTSTVDYTPTVQFFTVGTGPAPPRNVRIIR